MNKKRAEAKRDDVCLRFAPAQETGRIIGFSPEMPTPTHLDLLGL